MPASQTRKELIVELMLSVFRLNGKLLAKGDELVAPLGLTSARWQVLGAIALAGDPLTTPQVAEAMGITRQGALKQLDRLEEEGLVTRQENPRHERSPLYHLTPRGQTIYDQAMALNDRWVSVLTEGLKGSDLETTLSTLARFDDRLDSPLPKKEKR